MIDSMKTVLFFDSNIIVIAAKNATANHFLSRAIYSKQNQGKQNLSI